MVKLKHGDRTVEAFHRLPEFKYIERIDRPVYGFYGGGDDAGVTATVPRSTELMKAAGKMYELVTYEEPTAALCAPAKLQTQRM